MAQLPWVVQFMSHSRLGNNCGRPNNAAKGITVVEILIAIFIFGIAMASLFTVVSLGLINSIAADKTTRAIYLAREGVDAVRNFRDTTTWANDGLGVLILNTPYHPVASSTPARWTMAQNKETIGIFERQIIFEAVRRDGSSNIVQSGGATDQNTKKVRVIISWQERGLSRDIDLEAYITNWR